MSQQGAYRPPLLIAWHVMYCLTLVAFMYRSLIPVGFMPDPSALRDGRVAITFCTSSGGLFAALVNVSGNSDHASEHDVAASAECPYGLLATQAVIPVVNATVLLAAVLHRAPPAPSSNIALPPSPAQGPPLGSRAPPLDLA